MSKLKMKYENQVWELWLKYEEAVELFEIHLNLQKEKGIESVSETMKTTHDLGVYLLPTLSRINDLFSSETDSNEHRKYPNVDFEGHIERLNRIIDELTRHFHSFPIKPKSPIYAKAKKMVKDRLNAMIWCKERVVDGSIVLHDSNISLI